MSLKVLTAMSVVLHAVLAMHVHKRQIIMNPRTTTTATPDSVDQGELNSCVSHEAVGVLGASLSFTSLLLLVAVTKFRAFIWLYLRDRISSLLETGDFSIEISYEYRRHNSVARAFTLRLAGASTTQHVDNLALDDIDTANYYSARESPALNRPVDRTLDVLTSVAHGLQVR